MQKRILVVLLSFAIILAFSVDADAQILKKNKKKQRPAKTEQKEESSGSERGGSERSQRSASAKEESEGGFFTNEKLSFDIMGDFRIAPAGSATILKFGLKPAVAYKATPRISFGLAPKIEYYFVTVRDSPDFGEFDLGLEAFGRIKVIESIYLQLGYDFNNYLFFSGNTREWYNSAVIGGGYMMGFGRWKYGAQALFMLSERRREYNSPIELWFGLTYNL